MRSLNAILLYMLSPIPFYVVSFNRIKGLREASEFVNRSSVPLELIVMDMGSTWKPFIDYRDSLQVPVMHFPYGMGPRDLWVGGELSRIGQGAFFLSDGDIDYHNVSSDAAQKMIQVSNNFPWFPKVGLALTIVDLPLDTEGDRIRAWAKADWDVKWDKDIYLTGLDTTIAYYPRRDPTFYYRPCLRIGGKYQAIHYPWYEREGNSDEEARFYKSIADAKISSTKDSPWPTLNFRIKRSVIQFAYRFSRQPLRYRIFGPFLVRLLSSRGTIKPNLRTQPLNLA